MFLNDYYFKNKEDEGEDKMKLNLNTVNQAIKDSMIYGENEPVKSISLVLKGRVMIYNEGIKTKVGSGSFIGINDLDQGGYLSNYLAYDDVMIYTFDVQTINNIELILNTKSDYRGLLVCSLNKYITELAKGYYELRQGVDAVYHFFNDTKEKFAELSLRINEGAKKVDSITKKERYQSRQIIEEKKLQNYLESAIIPLDAYKVFYGHSVAATTLQVEEQIEMINSIMSECRELSNYIQEVFDGIASEDSACLYKVIANTAIQMGSSHPSYNQVVLIVDDIIEEVISIENLFHKNVGKSIEVNRESMQETYYQLLTDSKGDNKEQLADKDEYKEQEVTEILKNSLKQILKYSGMEEEFCKETQKLVDHFVHLKDKLSLEEEVRTLRKNISHKFYDLYQQVFIKAYKDEACPRTIDLFLKYGYMDENLLTIHQRVSLFNLEENARQQEFCHVYNIKEWLIAIYEGKKEPSKNEFDIDFRTMVRTKKNKKEITEMEEKEYYDNQEMKLEYEIKNMFQYNHRVVNGQVSIFIPILYDEMFLNNIEKSLVTAEKIDNEIKKLLEIDYSLFYREIMYSDESQGIKREYIMKQVFPDIILLPTHGTNSIMWQDISEKRRGNSGRFMLPIFSDMDLYDAIVKTCGRFRWELCRTLQGIAWNDIQVKSLTSEYSSYLQFYRKNRELSEEKKDKIKMQIQKGRNSSREVFAMDYETWVKHEALGSIRMNKIIREIMATYCPFSKNIRERIASQPLFEVAMARYLRETKKKIREMELRIHALTKENVTLPQDLVDTVDYYNNF